MKLSTMSTATVMTLSLGFISLQMANAMGNEQTVEISKTGKQDSAIINKINKMAKKRFGKRASLLGEIECQDNETSTRRKNQRVCAGTFEVAAKATPPKQPDLTPPPPPRLRIDTSNVLQISISFTVKAKSRSVASQVLFDRAKGNLIDTPKSTNLSCRSIPGTLPVECTGTFAARIVINPLTQQDAPPGAVAVTEDASAFKKNANRAFADARANAEQEARELLQKSRVKTLAIVCGQSRNSKLSAVCTGIFS